MHSVHRPPGRRSEIKVTLLAQHEHGHGRRMHGIRGPASDRELAFGGYLHSKAPAHGGDGVGFHGTAGFSIRGSVRRDDFVLLSGWQIDRHLLKAKRSTFDAKHQVSQYTGFVFLCQPFFEIFCIFHKFSFFLCNT
jgi:hypothetical protein